MNNYLHMHRKMLAEYERQDKEGWPSERLRDAYHALTWALNSAGRADDQDRPFAIHGVENRMRDLEVARAEICK